MKKSAEINLAAYSKRLQRAVEDEDSLALVLRGHLLIESILREMIEVGAGEPSLARAKAVTKRLNMRTCVDLCILLNLLNERWSSPIPVLVDMRNGAAHHPTAEIDEPQIAKAVENLPPLGKDIYDAIGTGGNKYQQLMRFIMAVVVSLNTHLSFFRSFPDAPRPPDDMIIRAMVNTKNDPIFSIPDKDRHK